MPNENKDTRWKQRFQNFEKALQLLERSLQLKNPSETERGGIIQFYEMTFELSWKLMKDYLNEEGYNVKSPRQALKQAFQAGIVENGQVWIDALEDRNLTTHTYDENTALEVEKEIRYNYFPALKQLYAYMKPEI